jgi:hypothetical protein
MIIGSGWRVVRIILKKCFVVLGGGSILNLSSVFRHSAKSLLPSVRKKYSTKNHLPIKCLPSVTLDKGFV